MPRQDSARIGKMAVVIDNFRLQEAPQASAHSVMTRVRMTDSVMMITACRRSLGDDPGKNDRLSDDNYRLPPAFGKDLEREFIGHGNMPCRAAWWGYAFPTYLTMNCAPKVGHKKTDLCQLANQQFQSAIGRSWSTGKECPLIALRRICVSVIAPS